MGLEDETPIEWVQYRPITLGDLMYSAPGLSIVFVSQVEFRENNCLHSQICGKLFWLAADG